MGCINSTKKLGEFRDVAANGNVGTDAHTDANNVYRARAVLLQPDMPMCRNGYLELTPREIVFLPAGTQNVPIIWSLQHLRRYGVNGEKFSFEAGRRCMTGPGIFTFRLQEADTLYALFQRYINDVTTLTDDMFQFQGHNMDNSFLITTTTTTANNAATATALTSEGAGGGGGGGASSAAATTTTTTTYNLSRSYAHTNNYLEPTNAQRSAAAARSDYFGNGSSSPMSMDLDSPDSLPSLSFGGNEVVHFSHNSRYTPQQIQAAAEQLSLQTTGNIYSERPIGTNQYQQQQHNNNNYTNNNNNNNNYANRSEVSIYGGGGGGCGMESTTASAFSTMSRKLMVRRSSMDMPPKECAPLLLTPTTPTLRLYANIEQWADGQISMAADNCYENINRSDLPIMQLSNNSNNNNNNNDMTTATTTTSASIINSNPTTPGCVTTISLSRMASIADPESMSLGSGGGGPEQSVTTTTSGMNYIVLDLDQPRSPAATTTGTTCLQYSPKTIFDNAFSIPNTMAIEEQQIDDGNPSNTPTRTDFENKLTNSMTTTTSSTTTSSSTTPTTTTTIITSGSIITTNTTTPPITTTTLTADISNEQLDYSTIDFVKTCALIESSLNGMDLDLNADEDLAEEEESRITRHSKCVKYI